MARIPRFFNQYPLEISDSVGYKRNAIEELYWAVVLISERDFIQPRLEIGIAKKGSADSFWFFNCRRKI